LYVHPPNSTGAGLARYAVVRDSTVSAYSWTVPLGANIVSHQQTATEDVVQVQFDTAVAGSFVSVVATNACGSSLARKLNLALYYPAAPGAISGPANACGYFDPNGLVATYTIAEVPQAGAYQWTLPQGAIGITGMGTRSVAFRYPAGFLGSTIAVAAVNGCASSASRTLPIAAAPVLGSINASFPSCILFPPRRVVEYSFDVEPGIWQFNWTIPPAGTLQSAAWRNIVVAYPPTAVAGEIRVTATDTCGNFLTRILPVNYPACSFNFQPTPTLSKIGRASSDAQNVTGLFIDVYPNPFVHDCQLKMRTVNKLDVFVKIADVQGRILQQLRCRPDQVFRLGAGLKTGVYLLEVQQAGRVVGSKLIKL
jgi:hypothetical protein